MENWSSDPDSRSPAAASSPAPTIVKSTGIAAFGILLPFSSATSTVT